MGPLKLKNARGSSLSMMDANDYKEEGNKQFLMFKFKEAISCYTKAINLNPNVSSFYTNRALVHIKLNQWVLVGHDCRTALEIDFNSVKGHFYLGQSLAETGHYDEAIAHLIKAKELANNQNLNYGDEIQNLILSTKSRKWLAAEEKKMEEEADIYLLLSNLISAEAEKQCIEAKSEEDKMEINKIFKKRQLELDELFAKVDQLRKSREVPDVLCGKISFDLMREPVITPSGITYDRKDIEEHLQRVGHFDPVTRTHLTQQHLIKNLAMKEIIDLFLSTNLWAEQL